MAVLNRALTWLFDAVMGPLDRLPPVAGLGILSFVTAIGVLLAFKWTADQRALAAAKRAMQAAVFEMRLFNDDMVTLFRAQVDVLRHTLRYLRLSMAPTLWLLVPMLLLMLHMEFRFGYTGLAIGEAALVTVQLARPGDTNGGAQDPLGASPGAVHAALDAPAGLGVETPAVFLPAVGEIVWRIRPRTAGSYDLRVRLGNGLLSKRVVVSERVARRSPLRPDGRLVDQLLHPSEPPLPNGSGVAGITVQYPARPFSIAGWDIGWLGVYLALTFVCAVALKGPFRVTM